MQLKFLRQLAKLAVTQRERDWERESADEREWEREQENDLWERGERKS